MSKKLTRENNEVVLKTTKHKQVQSAFKQVIDKETGEILSQEVEKHFVAQIKTDNFFMCFFENFGAFYGLKHLSDAKLLACLCELAEFNTGIVQLSTKVRKTISEKTGIGLTNLSRNIKRLKDSDLISEEDGEVVINPAVFWKGSIKERVEIIRNGGLMFNIRIVEEN